MTPRALRCADWLLRLAILLFALGVARQFFTRVGSAFGSVALLEWDVPHGRIVLWEQAAAIVLLVCAASVLIRPTVAALGIIAVLVFAEACAAVRAGGKPFSDATPYAHALRYLTPVALAAFAAAPRLAISPDIRVRAAAWILRAAIAVVFVTHGWEAWKLQPQFVDFIIMTGRKFGDLAISEARAASALKTIAIVDFLAAMLVLVRPWPPLLAWLALWGLVTALARPVSLGFASYPEVLLRGSHFLAPLAVACLAAWLRTRAAEPQRKDSAAD